MPIKASVRGLPYRAGLFPLALMISAVSILPGQTSSKAQRIDFYVGLTRLYPPAVATTEGTFRIVLNNSAFPRMLDLLVREHSGKIISQTLSSGKFEHRQGSTVTLAPGTYDVQVVGHPKWTSTIVVTPKH